MQVGQLGWEMSRQVLRLGARLLRCQHLSTSVRVAGSEQISRYPPRYPRIGRFQQTVPGLVRAALHARLSRSRSAQPCHVRSQVRAAGTHPGADAGPVCAGSSHTGFATAHARTGAAGLLKNVEISK